jgi:uncharacterized protein (DUF433 family)
LPLPTPPKVFYLGLFAEIVKQVYPRRSTGGGLLISTTRQLQYCHGRTRTPEDTEERLYALSLAVEAEQVAAEYIVDQRGERKRVILPLEEYERLLEAAEEGERMKKHPGIGFSGDEDSRRAWVRGTGLDVWELIEMYRIEGRETLLSAHPVSERHLDAALAYYEEYPEEIDGAIEENSRPSEYWMERYPEVNWKI